MAVVGAVALLIFWWWPGLVGRGSDVDVTVHVDARYAPGRESIERRLREQGWRVEWTTSTSGWCDVAASVGDSDPDADDIVLWVAGDAPCGTPSDIASQVVDAAKGRSLHVVVVADGDDPLVDALVARGASVVEAWRVVGIPNQSADCLWWEDCPASGQIEPWSGDRLSSVGFERVARAIVAEVR